MRTKILSSLGAIALLLSFQSQIPIVHAAVANNVGVAQSNLLMYFDLANPSGISGTSLTDLAGNFSAGTLMQTSSQPSLNTGNGKYLNFTGNGGYVDLPDITSASNWTGLSVSFYANMGTRTAVERIFDFGNGSQNNNIWVGMGDGNDMVIEVWRDNATPGWCRSANGSVVANEWAQWTAVLDGSTCKWYKNNTLSQSTNYTYLPWAKTLTLNYLGKSNWNDPYFEGYLGELAIYKSALTDAERLQNYNAQTDITPPALSGSGYVNVNENQTAVASLTANEASTFSEYATGNYTLFSITSNGVVTLDSPANYESPTVSNTLNYYFNVTDLNGNSQVQMIIVTILDVQEGSSLSPPTLSGTPYKGLYLTISVTPSGDGSSLPGKITYLIDGKRIPSCYKKTYSGTGNSTCNWKPAIMGNREVSVTFTPTNTSFTSSSSKRAFWVYKRATNR